MDEVAAYANVQELRDAGLYKVADEIETSGVPLEHIHFVDDEVVIILALDYEERRAKPLVKRSRWFIDVMQATFRRADAGIPWRYRNIVVAPDGA